MSFCCTCMSLYKTWHLCFALVFLTDSTHSHCFEYRLYSTQGKRQDMQRSMRLFTTDSAAVPTLTRLQSKSLHPPQLVNAPAFSCQWKIPPQIPPGCPKLQRVCRSQDRASWAITQHCNAGLTQVKHEATKTRNQTETSVPFFNNSPRWACVATATQH